ncbi:uncharacterized protein LOC141830108 [Curcuma longa]|uniref:uncharacterized protein LOC141830108 n=1 Tax=Curcuma longa TaxID=136217 RepID=UPI003D9E0F6A
MHDRTRSVKPCWDTTKTGRMFTSPELSDKFWSKMLGDLGKRIKSAFEARYPGNTTGVIPRVLFSYKYLENECKDAAFKRALKGLSFCNDIPIPGNYKRPEKKYGVRRSTTYKGKPHQSHARIEKRKHLVRNNKRCKCFLCGEEGHFARECPNEKRNVKRVAMFEQLDLPEDCDIVSVQEGEDQSDAIYSISEGEDNEDLVRGIHTLSLKEYICMFRETDHTYWVGKGGYLAMVQVSKKQYECQHQWELNGEVPAQYRRCHCCKMESIKRCRIYCPSCNITACALCGPHYFDKNVPMAQSTPIRYDQRNLLREQQDYIRWCEAEMKRMEKEIEALHQMHAEKVALMIREKEELELENERLQLENEDLRKSQKGKNVIIHEDEEAFEEELEEEAHELLEAQNSEGTSKVPLKIKRLSSTAIIPQRKTSGAAGYDLAADENGVIPSGGRLLIRTGICMEIPPKTYARIAPRSGMALRYGVNIGAGVIDSDYRGEIKVLVFNHSDREVEIRRGMCIAQIILEKILVPEVEEVAELTPTRNTGGFGSTEAVTVLLTEETQKILSAEDQTVAQPRRSKNMLFNLSIELDIPGAKVFKVHAILDTGATTCCIDQGSVPEEAIEDNPYLVHFSGINSKTTANKKLKYGRMVIGENHFRIPYTYAFPMKLGENIQMILGCNFIRSMQGGVRIEGNTVTFYKNITEIHTQPMVQAAAAIEELEMEEEEYLQIAEIASFGGATIQPSFQSSFEGLDGSSD